MKELKTKIGKTQKQGKKKQWIEVITEVNTEKTENIY